ncbi:MAG: hypothetical protein ACI8ZB_004385 [Desulforhopalus sp.]|jgi:hypothetical protein
MPHVTFIHGIANKPSPEELIEIWRRSLAQNDGINLATKGITSSMVYWADVMYAEPAKETEAHESVGAEAVVSDEDENTAWRAELKSEEKAFVDSFASRLNFEAASPGDDNFAPEPLGEPGFERIPLPWFIKRRLMKVLLRDVHHYLFNVEYSPRPGVSYRVRDEIRERFLNILRKDSADNAGKGPHVLVSHSMGTVISYDCLKRVPDCPKVDAFMTIGCPLGIDEVQDKLKPEWTREDGFPHGNVAGAWDNVYDRLDPVAFDTHLANDFRRSGEKIVVDQRQHNGGKWRHSIDKYLAQDELRRILAYQLKINWP